LTPCATLDSFGRFVGDDGYWPKRKIRKVEKGIRGSWGFAVEPFAQPLFIFRYTKGLIPNPPNKVPFGYGAIWLLITKWII
jgi:hypothetical protein